MLTAKADFRSAAMCRMNAVSDLPLPLESAVEP
jgi:hypothetical protein